MIVSVPLRILLQKFLVRGARLCSLVGRGGLVATVGQRLFGVGYDCHAALGDACGGAAYLASFLRFCAVAARSTS